jgi:hypothetical protein
LCAQVMDAAESVDEALAIFEQFAHGVEWQDCPCGEPACKRTVVAVRAGAL